MANKTEKKRCYFYTRVSTGLQVEGYSLDAQLEALQKEADYRDFEVVKHFSDEGKSGKNIKGRDDFREMMSRIQSGVDNIDFVLVFKLSRFGRNTADVLNSVQLMQDYGVNLICVKDGIDSSNNQGKLMISILAAVAEIERENIAEQTMAGRHQKAREGRWNGGFAPYGYKLVFDDSDVVEGGRKRAGKLVINEDEAEVIRAIFEKFAEGDIGLGGVAKWLDSKGYQKVIRQNGTVANFSAAFVKGVLDNPVYMGKIAYGRRKNEKIEGTHNEYHVVKQVGFDTYYEGIHEGIVSEELWYKAHEKRKITGKKNDKIYSLEHEHILSSLVKCPHCGSGMYGNISRKKKKAKGPNGEDLWYKDQYTYVCKHRKLVDGHKCDFSRQPNQDKINAEVEAIVREFILREAQGDGAVDEMTARTVAGRNLNQIGAEDVGKILDDRERLIKQYEQKVAAKDKLLERLDNLDATDITYDQKYEDMEKRLDKLYHEIKEIDERIEQTEIQFKLATEKVDTYEQTVAEIQDLLENGFENQTDAWKKQFYNGCIEQIDIFDEAQENGRWVKHIKFKLPVAYEDDKEVFDYYTDDSVDTVNHDETVCLLSRKAPV